MARIRQNAAPAKKPRGATKPSTPDSAEALPDLRYVLLAAIDIPGRPMRRDLGDISALAESLQDYGLQQPISVRAIGERYLLTSGLRRVHAARLLKWEHILAFVRSVGADHAYLLDLIENLQREDLTAEEEADALGELVRTRGWTLQQVGDAIKRSVTYVSRRVRIFEDPELRGAITDRGLPVSTAEVLLSAEPTMRDNLVRRALDEGWDQAHARVAVRALEQVTIANVDKDEQIEQVDRPDDRTGSPARTPVPQERGNIVGGSRPPGFTRAVREFHRAIMIVRPEDLTGADRAALRALFRDLVMLARASTTAMPRVFPPLPGAQGSR